MINRNYYQPTGDQYRRETKTDFLTNGIKF